VRRPTHIVARRAVVVALVCAALVGTTLVATLGAAPASASASAAAAAAKAPVPDPLASQVTVATYNVRTAEEEQAGHLWEDRLPAVAAQIDESKAGVIALEEAGANMGSVYTRPTGLDIDWQYEDLQKAVNQKYQLVSSTEYDKGDAGGKEGTRILYDTTRFSIVSSGFFAPSPIDRYLRFVPWAKFRSLTTGKTFYFIAVHLDNRTNTSALRSRQIVHIINRAKTFNADGNSQVIIAGDMNSNRYSVPFNTVAAKMRAAHLFDTFNATKVVNGAWATFNGFAKPKRDGSRTDYIETYGPYTGAYYYKNFVVKHGKAPSDHDMQVATLPY